MMGHTVLNISTRFSLTIDNEQADAGRDIRIRQARPNYQARTGTAKSVFPCLAYHEQDWQPYYPVDLNSAKCTC